MKWCGPKKKLGFPFDVWAVVRSPLRGRVKSDACADTIGRIGGGFW
jgi:hypothetical protein